MIAVKVVAPSLHDTSSYKAYMHPTIEYVSEITSTFEISVGSKAMQEKNLLICHSRVHRVSN